MERQSLGQGRYALIEELGRGGMATVWRAQDTRLGVERAIKILKPHLDTGHSNARARFEREARLMAGLEHPHITPVHDVGHEAGSVWIVMSLLRGGSLADHLKAFGPLPPRQAITVVSGVLAALGAAHEQGIVHRDIKPHNVLLDAGGSPRLADFGIARIEADNLTQTGAVMGTWAYMAPEQRLSAKDADPRSDVYSAGALLAALLTNHEPFDLHNPQSHDGQLANVPRSLRRFVARCTAYHPDDRFPGAAEAGEALSALVDALPADPPGTPALGSAVQARAQPAGALDTLPSGPGSASATYSEASDAAQESGGSTTTTVPWVFLGAGVLGSVGLTVGVGALLLAWPVGLLIHSWWAPDASDALDVSIEAERPLLEPSGPVAPQPSDPDAPGPDAPGPDAPGPDAPGPDAPGPDAPGPDAAPRSPVAQPTPRPTPPPGPVPAAGLQPPRPEPVPAAQPAPPAQPEPTAALPQGVLRVSSVPWSQVEIDGTLQGTTPWQGELSIGEHEVRLLREGEEPLTRRFRIDEGSPTSFCWSYAEEAPCRRSH